jgi:hypothetical protein
MLASSPKRFQSTILPLSLTKSENNCQSRRGGPPSAQMTGIGNCSATSPTTSHRPTGKYASMRSVMALASTAKIKL